MNDEDQSVRVRITGRVQGVWFRAWTKETAQSLGLSGWVRNRRDGSVEAVFCGPASRVDGMVDACRSGPPLARVDDIHLEVCEPPDPGFLTLPTR